MLATVTQVRNFVKSVADISGNGYDRRTWCDKRKAKGAAANERYVTFKFWDKAEADRVARDLQTAYKLSGITAKVKRTSTRSDYFARTDGGEYVRTIATFG